MSGWRLEGRGRRPWPEVRRMLAGHTCAWVDRYQLRIDAEPPAEPPVTTHLWAWSDGGYLRVRVDGDGGYVGVLRESDAAAGDEVAVIVRPRARMRPGPDTVPVDLLEVPGPGPVTFIRPARDE